METEQERTQKKQEPMSYHEYLTPIPAAASLVDHRYIRGNIIGRIIKPAKKDGKIEIQYLLVPTSGEPTFEPIVVRAKDVIPD